MKQDIIIAGVGGQGILSIAYVIDNAALKKGLYFKQAEVHGMAQRGGAVQSHLRLSSDPIFSELIPKGQTDIIISVEPLETLRYLEYLNLAGLVISSTSPFVNIPDYPNLKDIVSEIEKIDKSILIDSEKIAKEAGSNRAQNMVILGAASPYLMIEKTDMIGCIRELFSSKSEKLIELNLDAFERGRQMALSIHAV